MKIMISGGGTGGHIYPALTIADELKKIIPDVEIIYVGTAVGLEKDIVPRYGYDMRYIEVAGFRRSLSMDTLKSFYLLYKGLKQAKELIASEKPDLVIGTGGYVCGPIVYQAAKAGIVTCIQEQNAMPGVTNKILARYVNRVFLGYEAARKYFSGKAGVVYTGNPIRREIVNEDKGASYEELRLNPNMKTILVFGGSRGAKSINKAMVGVELKLSGRTDVQILHATGEANYTEHMKALGARGGVKDNIHVVPYLHNMPAAQAVADFTVCRAGAIGLAEIAAKGIPAILIPFPYATANHQEFNARAVEEKGAAKVILDKDINSTVLLEEIEFLLDNPEELGKMRRAALNLSSLGAGENVARQALGVWAMHNKNLHFVGVGGAGMSAIASVLLAKGIKVQGSDVNKSEIVDRLISQGAKIAVGHAAENIKNADALILSTAIRSNNPEVVAAKEKGLPVLHRSDALSWLVNDGDGVTVAGAHGKTTTTSMLACIAQKANLGATSLIGGDVVQLGGNAVTGKGNWVIAEADESDGSFLKFHPQIAVVTNIEDDHLDHYGSMENLCDAFKQYLHNLKPGGLAVLCADNLNTAKLAELVSVPVVTYGIENGDYTAKEIVYKGKETTYKLYCDNEFVADVKLVVPGRHNVENSVGAFAVAKSMGVDEKIILEALADFHGAKRRFETKALVNDIWFVDDYAHHPTEIKAVLKAAKQTGSKRIVGCFQPHRYTRTKLLLEEFKHAFDDCDILVVTDVYAASEDPIEDGTSDVLVNAIKEATGKEVIYTPSFDEAFNYLKDIIKSGDLVMSIGAGRADLIIERLAKEEERKHG
ncbi:MAG: UDP-N-acetylmuramate--L-alanine ligase [Phascolarctobacterium sp.]|nr:UDP-N-acetylmuramate--L-alanine ligase [Phascolarctobacterium sp.]